MPLITASKFYNLITPVGYTLHMGTNLKTNTTAVMLRVVNKDRFWGLKVIKKMTTVSGILCKGSLESDSELVLEGEILEFMKISRHPNEFPTKKALLDAGRSDLVDAIITKGGWMSLGWDDEDEDEDDDDDIWDMNARFDSSLTSCSSSHQYASSSGRSVETVIQEDAWLEGILYRLDHWKSIEVCLLALACKKMDIVYMIRAKSMTVKEFTDVTATVPYSVVKSNRHDAMDSNNVKSQLHQMKHELSSSLRLLRFTKDKKTNNLPNDHKSSSSELHRLPDTWEFHENEDFKVKDRLKSVCAELAVLEGKLTSSIIHAQELVKKKQRRINGGCRNLQLRNVCIIWHDSASEVLLAGSVDGWTTQRKMKKSEAGVFHLSLKLYPGRYEYKFIVDGVWRVDLLRPIVNKNGYENNVLIIPE